MTFNKLQTGAVSSSVLVPSADSLSICSNACDCRQDHAGQVLYNDGTYTAWGGSDSALYTTQLE